MFFLKLREKILGQETIIARLTERLKLAENERDVLRSQLETRDKSLEMYEGIDKEEAGLLRELRIADIKKQIQSIQIDQQKEAVEQYDIKPKKFD